MRKNHRLIACQDYYHLIDIRILSLDRYWQQEETAATSNGRTRRFRTSIDSELFRASGFSTAEWEEALGHSLSYAHPVVDLRALANHNFSLGCLFSFVAGLGIFSTIYLTPVFLGEVRGFTALQISATVFWTGVFQVASIPL